MKTLFENAKIINFINGNINVIRDGCLVVEGEFITYIGEKKPKGEFDSVKNMKGALLMPGLYNCHTHSPMTLLRGVGSDLPLDKWLFDKIFPIEEKLCAEDIKAASDLAIMEMAQSGTISFSDMYFEPAETAKAAVSAGIKANICRPIQSFDADEKPENSYRIKEAEELYNNFNGCADGRILIDFCIHAEYTCNERMTKYCGEMCREKNANMHIHLSETEKEQRECIEKYGVTPTEWFERLGVFENRTSAAHCVALTSGDADILKRHNVSIIHNPTSNMKLGSGFAPVEKFMNMGINVALGTDGAASNNNLNMLEEMHLASVIHKGFNKNAEIMKADRIIKMATLNGAHAQGREKCGNLLAGYKADIIALSLDGPHMRPCFDEVALIVYCASASDVCITMCDGKIIYENGEFLTIDKEKTYYNMEKAVKRLYQQ